MPEAPHISVVIPTYNRCRLLARTLESLGEQSFSAERYEIVVVVDGSTDGTIQMLQRVSSRCALRIIEQPNQGQANACNGGARLAAGGLLLFLDDDMLCDKNLLAAHYAAHQGGERLVVQGHTTPEAESRPTFGGDAVRAGLEKYHAELDEGLHGCRLNDAWLGPNCSLSRALFLELGGYNDAQLPYRCEDVEFGIRLWKAGAGFRYCRTAEVQHTWAKSASSALRDLELDGQGLVRLCRMHPEYRRHTGLAGLLNASAGKRAAVRALVGMPLVLESAGAVCRLAERLRPRSAIWRAGAWAHGVTSSLCVVRGAVAEAGSWNAICAMFAVRLPVLLFHRVAPAAPGGRFPELSVTLARFERHVRWLKRLGFQTIRAAEWIDWLHLGKPLPARPVLLSFDDAYASVAEHALPVVKHHGYTATVFVISRQLGALATWDGAKLMTATEIREWASQGIEFGAHSRTHPDLRALTPALLADEVDGSSRDLAQLLGSTPVAFAYPYGEVNPVVAAAAGRVFEAAFTCEEGLNRLSTDPVLLHRTMVLPGDSVFDLAFQLWLGRSPLHKLRMRLAFRTRIRRLFALCGFRSG